MMYELRDYQKQAANSVIKALNKNTHKVKIQLQSGVGKDAIMLSVAKQWIANNKNSTVVILTTRIVLREQLLHIARTMINSVPVTDSIKNYTGQELLITTYADFYKLNEKRSFGERLVICDDVHTLHNQENLFVLDNKKTYCVGVFATEQISKNSYFYDSQTVFKYTIDDATKAGYLMKYNDELVISNVIAPMLEMYGFNNLQTEKPTGYKREFYPDVVAKYNGQNIFIELKIYRDEYVSKNTIFNAVEQLNRIKAEIKGQYILIALCNIDEDFKFNISNEYNISVLDIKNIIYLCNENKELFKELVKAIPYPISSIQAVKPIGEFNLKPIKRNLQQENILQSEALIKRLEKCSVGRKSAREYEQICTEIIKYLFETEFSQVSEQNCTEDKMFRMDLLCAIKGDSAFWKFLMYFYKTKFVVFEYKNSGNKIPQNLVYITEKYLFSAALRNVAFIISRKGFDKNAEQAYMGILKEESKLIISLTDEDLVKMLKIKDNAMEPSDYLLDKVERMLMLISK